MPATRLDWSLELDPDNPMQLKDEAISIYDTDVWRKMIDKEKAWLRRELQANSISQFMHGEQGALIATAKIVATVPDMNAKFYAATQVMDEARHVEAYKRLLHEKFGVAYPINKALQDAARADADRPALGHDLSRHAGADRGAGAGRLPVDPRQGGQHAGRRRSTPMSCRTRRGTCRSAGWRCANTIRSSPTPSATSARSSRSRRSISCATASTRRRCGSGSACRQQMLDDIHYNSKQMNSFRGRLFSRVVPTIKDIGLWGPRMQKAFAEMGVMDYAKIDVAEQLAKDGQVAEEFDARMFVEKSIAAE